MLKTSFLIQGSAVEPYAIEFEKTGSNLRATCTCPAGEMHQYCKHITQILYELPSTESGTNQYTATDVRSWLAGSKLETALNALKFAEATLAQAKTAASQAKRNVSAAMHG